jgi:uncharacterized metal-binding protein YceD (DUF177 family)
MIPPELSRPVRIDTLGETPRTVEVEASPAEREALARRFGLVEIAELAAEAALLRKGVEVEARGRLHARVTQACVATDEPVEAELDEPFEILFRPTPAEAKADEEIELDAAEMDVVFYDGSSVDIGEAVAETLSLSLDPYPRSPSAEAALKSAGVKSEEEAGPFGALAALRDKLGK